MLMLTQYSCHLERRKLSALHFQINSVTMNFDIVASTIADSCVSSLDFNHKISKFFLILLSIIDLLILIGNLQQLFKRKCAGRWRPLLKLKLNGRRSRKL